MSLTNFKKTLVELYDGTSDAAYNFRYVLFILDISTILFLVISSFFYGLKIILIIDAIFGLYLAVDYLSRLWISPRKWHFAANIINIADLIAMISFLIPIFAGELAGQFAFLRIVRVLRLLRSYRLISRLRQDFLFFRKHEDLITRATNLLIFIFVMTELVFVTQLGINPKITNFLDALYFSTSTLTTTGFGDITLQGQYGYPLSIIIMIFGVSLFLRLMHTIFSTSKMHYKCTGCGLFLHEKDSKFCKHCGTIMNIHDEKKEAQTSSSKFV